ncbi:hypothetical protein K2173_017034 [Erythroxylum novogranatense]|uniref:CLAVATA3/ESR (CLE)-related protein 12 n=1 Tax=Erythroxylum novogranatense TaxID=1862640 RepID=A0AAV8U9T0_9ROSI|nr:hypothetical protein K2173_017034 [Erythroxylum novogranatense]
MAMKTPQTICIVLWLFVLIFLMFHELHAFKFRKEVTDMKKYSGVISLNRHYRSRKVLTSKFDFTSFQKNHHQLDEKHPPEAATETAAAEEKKIDPRYGVEKRLVPTGPNPLHH